MYIYIYKHVCIYMTSTREVAVFCDTEQQSSGQWTDTSTGSNKNRDRSNHKRYSTFSRDMTALRHRAAQLLSPAATSTTST